MSMNVVVKYLVRDIRDTFERAILSRVTRNNGDEYLRLSELMEGIRSLLNRSDLARGSWPCEYQQGSEEDVDSSDSSEDSVQSGSTS